MKFFNNKFFISFLVLTVLFYSFSVKTAAAGDFVGDFFGGIVDIIDTVFNDQSSVDSCSINNSIGNLTSLPTGSLDVRPSQGTVSAWNF